MLRGTETRDLQVRAVELSQPLDQVAGLSDPDKHIVRRLGVLALNVDERVLRMVRLREGAGAIVVARTLDDTGINTGLLPGDTIHALNRTTIDSVETLRRALKDRQRGEAVVLQIEREGRYRYLFFVMD